MKKTYQKPELEKVLLETEEPVTLDLGIGSNIFRLIADDEDEKTPINL